MSSWALDGRIQTGIQLNACRNEPACDPCGVKRWRVTMADIAAKLGVSCIAVSMALRDYHRISCERRREIRQVAREMGFVPDPFLSVRR